MFPKAFWWFCRFSNAFCKLLGDAGDVGEDGWESTLGLAFALIL